MILFPIWVTVCDLVAKKKIQWWITSYIRRHIESRWFLVHLRKKWRRILISYFSTSEQICPSSEGSTEDEQDVESSDSDYPTKSKRELREEQDSKVYTIATDSLIKSLMTEYKRRKQANAMPKFVKISKKTKKSKERKPMEFVDKVERQIEEQRKTSYMKVCV